MLSWVPGDKGSIVLTQSGFPWEPMSAVGRSHASLMLYDTSSPHSSSHSEYFKNVCLWKTLQAFTFRREEDGGNFLIMFIKIVEER